MNAYITAQILFGFVIGVTLFFAGREVWRNRPSDAFRSATAMFVLWWCALGAAWIAWSTDTFLVNGVADSRAAALADYLLIVLYTLLVLMSFASLFYYLLVLYFGKTSLAGAAWVVYGLLTLGVLAIFVTQNPLGSYHLTGVKDSIFGQYLALATDLRIVLYLPILVASLALFFVVRRSPTSRVRYRVLLISLSLFFYLLVPLFFPSNPGIEPADAGAWIKELLNKAALIVAVVALMLAYHPPARIAARLTRDPEEAR